MKDPRQDTVPRTRLLRFAVFALAALVVLSLGFVLVPAEKPAPAEPPFSEQARAAALTAALDLRAAGLKLTSTGDANPAALDPVVTLLTIQARALMVPAAGSATAAAHTSPPPTAPHASTDGPRNLAELVLALADSGRTRVKDAETADGGMARLLAGAGTAQLIAAGRLAAATAVPLPQEAAGTDAEVPGTSATASSCPSPSAPAARESTRPGTPPGTRQALAAAISAEQQAVYGYQAALPRLAPAETGTAAEFLARHKELAGAAEERLRLACGGYVPQQPGYVLDPGFLVAPGAALGKLEAATLASYGDVVAVSQGQDRRWALAALQAAARRAQRWGADPGPVPGLTLDAGQLPALPPDDALPSGTGQTPSPATS